MMRFLAFLLSSAALVAEAAYIVEAAYSDKDCKNKDAANSKKMAQFQDKSSADTMAEKKKNGYTEYPNDASSAGAKTDFCYVTKTETREEGKKYTCTVGEDTKTFQMFGKADCSDPIGDPIESTIQSCKELSDSEKTYIKEEYQIDITGKVWIMESCSDKPGSGSSAASTFAAFPGVAVVMAFLAIAA